MKVNIREICETKVNGDYSHSYGIKSNVIVNMLMALCNDDLDIISDKVYKTDGEFDMTIIINGKELNPTLFLEKVYQTLTNKWEEIEKFKNKFQSKNSDNAKLQKVLEQFNSVKNQMTNIEEMLNNLNKK
jgi:hypothetical protein